MPPNLTGYYRFVSQKNLEDYLKALNIHVALRKLVLLLKPDKEIDDRGTHMTVKTLSPFRNYVMEFEVGVEFEEDLRIVDGRKCQTIVTWEEEQLVCVQRGEVPNRGWRHWLEGEKLYLAPGRSPFFLKLHCPVADLTCSSRSGLPDERNRKRRKSPGEQPVSTLASSVPSKN